MEWMLMPYRRYAEFSGRSQRKEYWMFFLLNVLVSSAIAIIFGTSDTHTVGFRVGFSSALSGPGDVLQNLFGLVSFVPNLAVGVRRLHDTDRSGWWLLLWLLPIVGWIAILIFLCQDGTPGPNRFGENPKDVGVSDVFA